MPCLLGERHAARAPAQRSVGVQRDRCRPAAPARPTSRLAGACQPGARQQPAGEQRLGERNRDRVAPGDAEHREAVGQLRACAAAVPPAPRRASARFSDERLPQRAPSSRRRARLLIVLRIGQIGENARRGFGDKVARSRRFPHVFRSAARLRAMVGQAAALASRATVAAIRRKAGQTSATPRHFLHPSSGLPRRIAAVSVRAARIKSGQRATCPRQHGRRHE